MAVAALYWLPAILLPLALAALLAFLLSPAVGVLRRWGLGRVVSALLVVLLLCAASSRRSSAVRTPSATSKGC